MPSRTLDVELRGWDVLRRKLSSGNFLGPVKQEMIAEATKAGKQTAVTKSRGRAGTGGIGRAVGISFEQDGLIGKVYVPSSLVRKATSIEEGRPPGKNVPYKPLTAWAGRAGMQTDRGSIRALRAEIKGRGTPGTHFMREAQEQAERTLKQRGPPTEREIERAWNA